MLVGLQGAGKTTNGSKLAGLMKRQGRNPLLVACDVYRPAAIQQLKVCGEKLGIPVFERGTQDPVKLFFMLASVATTWCFWILPAASMWTSS